MNLIFYLTRPLEKVLKKDKYIAIKWHNIPGDNDSGSYEISLLYYGGLSPEKWLVWEEKSFKVLDGQRIIMGPKRYTFTARLLTSDAKASFYQATLGVSIHTIEDSNKTLLEMTKHAFPTYAFRE